MDEQALTRSACRIFGHIWGRPEYAAYRAPSSRGVGAGVGALRIRRQRTCTRCGNVEALER